MRAIMAFSPDSTVAGPDKFSSIVQAVTSINIRNGTGHCNGAQLLEGKSHNLSYPYYIFQKNIFIYHQEEPLSPTFSGLEEAQTDVWQFFSDDVVKQAQSPQKDPVGDLGGWLPDSPSDSCDSLDGLKAKGQLASQLLENLDFIKDENSFSDWYETKTDLPIYDELPSPTSSQEALAARPFATLTPPFGAMPTFAAPAAPIAVPVPPSAVQPLQSLLLPVQSLQGLEALQALQGLQQPRHSAAAAAPVGLLTMAAPQQLLPPPPVDTQALLQEFETVLGSVEQSHHSGALTPPQSPPHEVAVAHAALYSLAQDEFRGYTLGYTQQQQQLIAEVDELVSARAPRPEEAWPAPALPSFAPPSPCTSSSCSFSSESPASPASPASPTSPASSTDDPDWVPELAAPEDTPVAVKGTSKSPAKAAAAASRRKRAAKPYSNGVEDKRMRKKEQNKNAATRYRMKKKAEVEEILGEENELKEKNDELAAKVTDLSQEIRYLKGLMRDLFRSKGLIK